MIFLSGFFLLINILFILLTIFLIVAFFTGAPFIPTPKKIVDEMVNLTQVKETDNVVDLGSGDGRLLIAAAKKGSKGTGWEINPILVFWSKLKAYFAGVSDKVTIHWADYMQASLGQPDIVFLFSITDKMASIENKLVEELKSGTKLVSYTFTFPQLKPKFKTISGIYLYYL